jgi:hypothetical protein
VRETVTGESIRASNDLKSHMKWDKINSMSSRTKSATVTKAPAGKCLDELEVDCDIARDIISQYFAVTASELASEKDNKSPDKDRIGALETRLQELHQEKMQLSTVNAEMITKAFTMYAKVMKDKFNR